MKTLLLGSAAAFAFAAGSAQAADLSVAEPVDYVRVCDAFGTGYYYIPGTDTCLRIGGFVRFELQFAGDEYVVNNDDDEDAHYESYNFFTRANFQIEARSQTDWGPLIGYMEFETDIKASNGTYNSSPEVQEAFLSIGPLTAGLKQSAYDFGGGYTMSGLDDGYSDGTAITDNKLNQIQLAWAMNGFGIILAVEDQQARAQDWGGDGSVAGDIPDLVAAVTGEWGNVSAKVAFLYSDMTGWGDSGLWGVQGGVEVTDLFGGKDKMVVAAGYISELNGADIWSVLGSFRHYWMSNLYSAVTVRYDDSTNSWSGCGCTDWTVAFDTRYSPVEDFYIAGQVVYTDSSDSWVGKVRLQRDFNN
jgi:hypothetical protein